MRRRENSASKTPSRTSSHLDVPEVRSTSHPTKKKADPKVKEMKVQEKPATKGSRISSLMHEDPSYPKPPTPFPDQEKAELDSRSRRSQSRIGDTKSLASAQDIEMAPRPPVAPHPPDIRHRPHRPTHEMPKIDLTFETVTLGALIEEDIILANRMGTSDAHAQDRSRKFGMTYLEKAYDKPGFHLPDIRDSNMMISRTADKSRPSGKPSVINLDLPDDYSVASKSEITLPEVNRKPLLSMDNRNLPTPQQGLPPRPPRKSAVRRFPDETQAEHDKRMLSPKPPKTAASEHLPRVSLNKNVTLQRQSPRETIGDAFEKLPTTNQQKALKNNWIVPEEELSAPTEWSPSQKTAVEYLPNIATRSPLHTPPHVYGHQNKVPLEDLADVLVAYGSPPPRIMKGHHSDYVPQANRVTCHAEKLNDVEVHTDGTLVIGLDDMHISPDALSPSPPGMAGNGREKKPLVYPTPKKLSITEQITSFKENQTTEARDARARVVQAEVAWRCERKLGDLKEEEERKFREQQYVQETISKPKPPYHLESRYLAAPPSSEIAPGQAGQQLPASLRKRRQPRAKKDW